MRAADFDLRHALHFQPQEGRLLLGRDRMLLFRQESLGVLRGLLDSQLGPRLTRAILAQFGYRCGEGDFTALMEMHDWETDMDRIASGPVMHMWEGIVHVEPTKIDFDKATGRFHMTGLWRNSYEAELHLARFGRSTEPVCHSLTGYASGWATAFFGRPLLAIETQCVGRGDSICAFDIRPFAEWGPEANPWRDALASTEVALSLQLEARVAERTRELVRANEELLRAKVAAESAALARSQFLAVMSHEVRTPIAAILGLAELALQDPKRTAETHGERDEVVETIRTAGESLLTIVNDILDFSKIDAGHLEIERRPFDVRACVRGAIGLLRGRAEEKWLTLEAVIDDAVPRYLLGDSLRLRQVIVNLLSNAIKFTDVGRVLVEVGVGAGPQPTLRIAVADTGEGIAEGKLPWLFEPFTQADASTARRHGGTGLGLTISRLLAELLGGSLHAESVVGWGSRFVVELPLLPVDPAVAEAGLSRSATPVEGPLAESLPLRILVAEDNALLARIAVAFLDRQGYSATVATDGRRAVELAASQDYDLILMDVQMPELDGPEAARRIRAAQRGTHRPWIVALTANAFESDRQACLAAGMDDFLAKPLSAQLLREALQRVRLTRS